MVTPLLLQATPIVVIDCVTRPDETIDYYWTNIILRAHTFIITPTDWPIWQERRRDRRKQEPRLTLRPVLQRIAGRACCWRRGREDQCQCDMTYCCHWTPSVDGDDDYSPDTPIELTRKSHCRSYPIVDLFPMTWLTIIDLFLINSTFPMPDQTNLPNHYHDRDPLIFRQTLEPGRPDYWPGLTVWWRPQWPQAYWTDQQ